MKSYPKLFKEYSKEVQEILTEVSELPTFKKRFEFIKSRTDLFKPLSKAGSSRLVYEIIPTQTVLKLAYKEAGLDQNKIECDYILKSSIFPDVIDFYENDEGVVFIECEKAEKVKKSEFKTLIGLTFDELSSFILNFAKDRSLKYARSSSISFELQSKINSMYNDSDSFISEFQSTLGNYDFMANDLCKINSYGKIKGNLVIIDYGLTVDTYDDFYVKVKKGGKKLQ